MWFARGFFCSSYNFWFEEEEEQRDQHVDISPLISKSFLNFIFAYGEGVIFSTSVSQGFYLYNRWKIIRHIIRKE